MIPPLHTKQAVTTENTNQRAVFEGWKFSDYPGKHRLENCFCQATFCFQAPNLLGILLIPATVWESQCYITETVKENGSHKLQFEPLLKTYHQTSNSYFEVGS